MTTLNRKEAVKTINSFIKSETPFLLISDFEGELNSVEALENIDQREILFDINGTKNFRNIPKNGKAFSLEKHPVSYKDFNKAFDKVQKHLHIGNSYLTNLTFSTPVKCNFSLQEIFFHSKARYKLWVKDQFVVFSPEIFVQWRNNKLYSYPMKGTIDAKEIDAAFKILHNEKEMAEHVSIVDLIRNDMSIHSKNVHVKRFRYLEELQTHEKKLLQVSSEIVGEYEMGDNENFGEVLYSLIPGGSISGVPKKRTVEIIKECEDHQRGYYTGICGIYDGKSFDSGVMIRFIEQQNDELVFKSGGGIHSLSDPQLEYQEMIDKVYVPIY